MAIYFDREGRRLHRGEWARVIGPKGEIIHEYMNDKFHFIVRFTGMADENAPPEHRKMWDVQTFNHITTDYNGIALAEAKWVRDPDASDTFRTEEEALNLYNFLLAEYTPSELIYSAESGKSYIQEKGNLLAPPPPDAPDLRGATEEVQDICGSW